MNPTCTIWLQSVGFGFEIWHFTVYGILGIRWVVSHWPQRAQLETFGEFSWTGDPHA